jgi:ATP-binding cassette, subfamily F, member 3
VEAAIGDCETSLLTFVSAEETQRVTQEVNARREELQALMAEWEELGRVLQA